MAKISEVTLKGMSFSIYSLTGEVKDSRKWTSTHVSGGGGGGGGYLHGGSGYVSTQPVTITSTTTTHDQLFVQASDGQEICVETSDANLQVRPGHKVSVLWGIKNGKDRGNYWTIYNHNTKQIEWLPNGLRHSFSPWYFGRGEFWVGFSILSGMFGGCGVVWKESNTLFNFSPFFFLGIWTVWIFLRIRAREKQIKAAFAHELLPKISSGSGPNEQAQDSSDALWF